MTNLALVAPLPADATQVRKPNRRPGSCPAPPKVTQLRPRQAASPSGDAVSMAGLVMAGGPEFAAQVGQAIRLALLEAGAS